MPSLFYFMEDIDKLLDISHRIEKGEKTPVKVLGKTFMIGDLKRNVVNKIYDIQFKVKYYEGGDDLRTLKKRVRYVNSSDARIASLILLNSKSNIPFLHSIHWRYLNKKYTSETFNAIIESGLNNKEHAFFLKSSALLRQLLMTRMMMVKS